MRNKRVKGIIYLTCLCMLSGCGTVAGENRTASNDIAADYEAERIMPEEELAAVEWKETLLPYMEYDWLEDEHIERYLDTVWTMQLTDLNQDGQEEMLVILPVYNGESRTYVYTVEEETVVYCGQIVAGPAYEDNEAFISAGGYLPSGYIDVYQNESGEFRYLSGNTFLKGDHGYYQIYESGFVENHISCKPLYWIDFNQEAQGQMIYQYAEGDRQEQEHVLTDGRDFTKFAQAMDTYMEGWEKADIAVFTSEFRVPGFVDELTEDKKEIIRDNIRAGIAIALAEPEESGTVEKPVTEEFADVTAFFDSITGDMLDAYTMPPETIEEFDNDPLILLNWYQDDIRLYGMNVKGEQAMLLYIEGEKLLIPCRYGNIYRSIPQMNVSDIDEDGAEEVVISSVAGTGTPGYWFTLLVCDKKENWLVHVYDHKVEDIEALMEYQYDEASNVISFLNRKDGTLLVELPLPEWTEEYPYEGKVEYANSIRYDIENMQMQSEPWILLEDSLPYWPVLFLFDIQYHDGEFAIELNDIQMKNTND